VPLRIWMYRPGRYERSVNAGGPGELWCTRLWDRVCESGGWVPHRRGSVSRWRLLDISACTGRGLDV
jgi:hypothetical protein